MTPDDLRATLARMNLTQTRAAKLLQIHERTMRGYAAGRAIIPRVVQLALRGLEADGVDGKA